MEVPGSNPAMYAFFSNPTNHVLYHHFFCSISLFDFLVTRETALPTASRSLFGRIHPYPQRLSYMNILRFQSLLFHSTTGHMWPSGSASTRVSHDDECCYGRIKILVGLKFKQLARNPAGRDLAGGRESPEWISINYLINQSTCFRRFGSCESRLQVMKKNVQTWME